MTGSIISLIVFLILFSIYKYKAGSSAKKTCKTSKKTVVVNKEVERRTNLYETINKTFEHQLKEKPNDEDTYIKWGISLSKTAAIEGVDLKQEACNKFEIATKIAPKDGTAYACWAELLFLSAHKKNNDTDYRQAVSKIEKAALLHPNTNIFASWAFNMARWGIRQNKLSIISQSLPIFEKAYQLSFDNVNDRIVILTNWSNVLYDLSVMTNSTAPLEKSYQLQCEILELDPNNLDALYYAAINTAQQSMLLHNNKLALTCFSIIKRYMNIENTSNTKAVGTLYTIWAKLLYFRGIYYSDNSLLFQSIKKSKAAIAFNPNKQYTIEYNTTTQNDNLSQQAFDALRSAFYSSDNHQKHNYDYIAVMHDLVLDRKQRQLLKSFICICQDAVKKNNKQGILYVYQAKMMIEMAKINKSLLKDAAKIKSLLTIANSRSSGIGDFQLVHLYALLYKGGTVPQWVRDEMRNTPHLRELVVREIADSKMFNKLLNSVSLN